MTIEEFHNEYWFGKPLSLDDHMYYREKAGEKKRYWDEEIYGQFDPHYSMLNYSARVGRVFTPKVIESMFDSVDWGRYNGKKFTLGDYTFYGFASKKYHDTSSKTYYCEYAIYLDYHGYRLQALKLQQINYEDSSSYSKSLEGLEILIELLQSNPEVQLVDYKIEELTGPKGFNKEPKSQYGLTPSCYLQKPHPEYKWSGEDIGEIDLDHFIKMDVKNGVYKPTNSIMSKLRSYENQKLLKSTLTHLKDFGVHTVKLLNNSNWDICEYYDLEGVEVKASKSVLSNYPKMRDYSADKEIVSQIQAEEKAREEKYQQEVYNDTYTLMQHGRVILDGARSYEIASYFENKTEKDFELSVIEAGRQCFEVAPELDKIFFVRYGIYSYTEMSGERFADFENIESINSSKGITLPKRLTFLITSGSIEAPYLSKDDKTFVFEKGATYLGAAKDSDGKITMIQESGEQGI